MDTLPCNLLHQILLSLDPKSLASMQCADRYINSHVCDDLYFRSEYLSRVGAGLIHISSHGATSLSCYPSGDSTLYRNKDPLEISTRILCSCSGLLLLLMEGRLCVANPLTKMYRFLDRSESKFLSRVGRRSGEVRFRLQCCKLNRIGFAVDQMDRTTQRFKVVCMKDTDDDEDPDETVYQFESSTGSFCWRLSKTSITCSASLVDKKPVYLDGSLHWLREDGSIIAFNPETEQARLVPVKFPFKLSRSDLFTAAEGELALISATAELIYVYFLENILTDPKWVLAKQIRNGAVEKTRSEYWHVGAYDGKSLVVREIKEGLGVVHGYDLKAEEWGVIGSIPEWCDCTQDFYHFKLSLSVARELNEKMDVEMMTMVRGDDGRRISSLRKIMGLIDDISPYARAWLKRNEKRLGNGLMVEEESTLKMIQYNNKLPHLAENNKRKRSSITNKMRITYVD